MLERQPTNACFHICNNICHSLFTCSPYSLRLCYIPVVFFQKHLFFFQLIYHFEEKTIFFSIKHLIKSRLLYMFCCYTTFLSTGDIQSAPLSYTNTTNHIIACFQEYTIYANRELVRTDQERRFPHHRYGFAWFGFDIKAGDS